VLIVHVPRAYLAKSEKHAWADSPFEGVSEKILKVGTRVGERDDDLAYDVVELTKIAEGASLPPHRHLGTQLSFFLEGTGRGLDGTTIPSGSYAEIPSGLRHGTTAVNGDVVILNFFEGAVTWILDEGDMFSLRGDGSFARVGKMSPLGTRNLF
jgi:quercetin dioxygenase-like cupin family protein